MTRPPVVVVVLYLCIACAVAAAIPGRADAQPSGSTPVVQQGETPGGQAEPKETQAKPAAPKSESAPAPKNPITDAVNVRLDVTISYQTGTQPPVVRTATLTVAETSGQVGRSYSLRAGNQVPVPNTTFVSSEKPEGGVGKPLISYTYRSVGISLDVRSVQVFANRVRTDISVEFSAVDEPRTGSPLPPSFPTFQQYFSLVLDSGKPILVAQSSDQVDKADRVQKVEIKATILR
jgi:hypothetical protein